MSRQRKCLICGKQYNYCRRCPDYASLPVWKTNYCSETCHTIADVLNRYFFNHLTKDEAKEILGQLTIPTIIGAEEQRLIADIMAEPEEEKPVARKRKRVTKVDDE